MEEASPASAPPYAETVGNEFVKQYYAFLQQSPEVLYRLYQDSSVLSWPDTNGVMTLVTTVQAINDKILSSDYKNCGAEIKSMDAQESYNKGVIVVVTGCLTGKDSVKRKFTQTFFLAPQETYYVVLNDVLKFIDESESLEISSVSVNGINETDSTACLPSDPEPPHSPSHPALDPATTIKAEDLDNGAKVSDPSDKDEKSVLEQQVVDELPTHSSQNEIISSVSSDIPIAQEEKKSYASIVKATKVAKASTPVYVATSTARPVPPTANKQMLGSPKPSLEPEAAAPTNAPDNKNVHEEVKGHSIYVRNLPLRMTFAQLEEVFKKFGPIKRDGIQIKSNQLGYCFGFVEFESSGSMQDAIKASPVTVGGRAAVVEEKRTTTPASNSGRGRYPTGTGRGGSRNDNFRGRGGNFGGGRGYNGRGGSQNYRNRNSEFSGRPKSRESYQRIDQNGSGIDGHQGGTDKAAVSS